MKRLLLAVIIFTGTFSAQVRNTPPVSARLLPHVVIVPAPVRDGLSLPATSIVRTPSQHVHAAAMHKHHQRRRG
jgi:hypothetical protein